MVTEIPLAAAFGVLVLAVFAEALHARRVRRASILAFGPGGRPAVWTLVAAPLRVVAFAAVAWGLATLWMIQPKAYKIGQSVAPGDWRHLVLVLDVSPSMKLTDAGPTKKQTRSERAADLLQSFIERAPIALYKVSVIAVYTEAKLVVDQTTDLEIIRNILADLPLVYAFKPGPTDLLKGLEEAAKLAKPWKPGSTTIMVVSDGDTVAPTGMPQMPASVVHTAIVGVGDPTAGQSIDGHQSRQDVSELRQTAVRLRGHYHNGNEKHLPSDLIARLSTVELEGALSRLTRREYALLSTAVGATVLAVLPMLLSAAGTNWRPGVQKRRGAAETAAPA